MLAIQLAVERNDVELAQDMIVDAGVWCDLNARRDKSALDEFGRFVKDLNAEWNNERVAQTLSDCRSDYLNIKPTQRRSTFIQRWLRGG